MSMDEHERVRPVPYLNAKAALTRVLATLTPKPVPKLRPRPDDEMKLGLDLLKYERGPRRRSEHE